MTVSQHYEECACPKCGCALGVEGAAGTICGRCQSGDHDVDDGADGWL